MNEVNACRSVLIEVRTILAKDLDKVAVVGGWVPELAFPSKGTSARSTWTWPSMPASSSHWPTNRTEGSCSTLGISSLRNCRIG